MIGLATSASRSEQDRCKQTRRLGKQEFHSRNPSHAMFIANNPTDRRLPNVRSYTRITISIRPASPSPEAERQFMSCRWMSAC